MNTCVNCDSPAEFTLTTPTPANYCENHLPGFARKTNQFVPFEPIPDVVVAAVEVPTPKTSNKKTTSEATAKEATAPAEEPTP